MRGAPVSVCFGCAVRTARIEWSGFSLWRFEYTAKHLRTASLIELTDQTAIPNCFQYSYGTKSGDITCVFRQVKTHAHMTLRSKVINFVGFNPIDQPGEVAAVNHVSKMESRRLLLPEQRIERAGIKSGRAPDQAMHFIAFAQEQLGKIGSVLPGDPRNECFLLPVDCKMPTSLCITGF